jgi:transcription antitermination protein NusB
LSRRRARKQAFLNLYQSDVNGSPISETLERWRAYRGEIEDYAVRLAVGVEEEREELDGLLSEVSLGWPLHRMNAVDRSVLRLALYEMLHVEDVPPDVAINEAVELVRGFSGEDAPAFVGGVLRGAESRIYGKVGHEGPG